MRYNVFWRKSKSGHAHLLALSHNYIDDVQGADQEETLNSRVVADWGGRVVSMFSQAEEVLENR